MANRGWVRTGKTCTWYSVKAYRYDGMALCVASTCLIVCVGILGRWIVFLGGCVAPRVPTRALNGRSPRNHERWIFYCQFQQPISNGIEFCLAYARGCRETRRCLGPVLVVRNVRCVGLKPFVRFTFRALLTGPLVCLRASLIMSQVSTTQMQCDVFPDRTGMHYGVDAEKESCQGKMW